MNQILQADKKYRNRLGNFVTLRRSPYPANFRGIAFASVDADGYILYYNGKGEVVAHESPNGEELRFIKDHSHWVDLDLVLEAVEPVPPTVALNAILTYPQWEGRA